MFFFLLEATFMKKSKNPISEKYKLCMLYILLAVINQISEVDCNLMSSCEWQEEDGGQSNKCNGICLFDLPNPAITTWTFLNDTSLDCGNSLRRVVMCESALQVILAVNILCILLNV